MMYSRAASILLPVASLALPCFASAASSLTFEKDVRPILKEHCFHCHGEDGETKGGLDVRLARFLLKGGKEGPAITVGKPEASHLVELLRTAEMPKGKGKLKDQDIATIEQWIAQGAKTARPEPEKLGPEHQFTDEERGWWAFQPVKKAAVPNFKVQVSSGVAAAAVKSFNPIDAFIVAKLEPHKLSFSPPSDPVTFIRRASFDLTGLPPTPEEVDAFVQDSIKNPKSSVATLIERLMAKPAYGERWGRHWLDVAGYSDSDGYTDKDLERKYAYKFRDYVIKALNDDKPFNEFVREQLAGDEIAAELGLNSNSPTAEQRTRYEELLRATGFLRMAPDGTGVESNVVSRNACVADTVKIVSTALYGLTVACAQCHDHRYDPISQQDYYRMRALFEPGFDTKNWRSPAGRLVSLQTAEQKAKGAEIEVEAKKVDAARLAKQESYIKEVLEKELAKADEPLRAPLRVAYNTVVAKRTPEQVKLLKDWPRINQLSAGSLYLYDTTYKTKYAAELKAMTDEAAKVRATKPAEEFVQAFTEVPKAPAAIPATFLFHRGDPEQPKDKVKPGDLSVMAGLRSVDVPEKAGSLPSSGRRLAFARSITDGKHPLLARVMVNRVWMHHFGKGLVASVGDFGKLGELPSHPELLDWLATEFMAKGWSIKHLHRLIMQSQTYQQSSKRETERERIDPDNRLLSRMNVLRLEAETLRDSLLAVSGRLNLEVGGASIPVTYNEEGGIVIGIDTRDTAGRQTGKFLGLNGDEYRRSIYIQARRSMPLEIFAAFDAPAMTEANCASRPVTTVSPQSLLLMNNSYMREHSQDFAARLLHECGTDVDKQVRRAWNLAFSREPSMADERDAVEFVKAQTEHYRTTPAKLEHAVGPAEKENAAPELLGVAALCHALMSANAFLYVD